MQAVNWSDERGAALKRKVKRFEYFEYGFFFLQEFYKRARDKNKLTIKRILRTVIKSFLLKLGFIDGQKGHKSNQRIEQRRRQLSIIEKYIITI
jgi:predicted PP-loop superfamily ATPase